jgi:uncharacterized protein
MAHPNEDLLRRGYAAFSSGDMDTVLSLMADDIAWHLGPGEAFPGDYHGPQEVLGMFGRLMQASGGTYRTDLHEVLANDTHGVVLANATAEKDGRMLTARAIHVWHLADGKATEHWALVDPPGAFNALRA